MGRASLPVRWRARSDASELAAFVFQHASIAALRRELLRNLQLRHLCGFDVFSGLDAVPSECAYTRFQRRLLDHEQEVEQIFHDAVDGVQEVLPDFGRALGIDGKELHSQANGPPTYGDDDHSQEIKDGRREQDADWGVKGGGAKDANGNSKKHSWFGFLLHLAVDTTYELPVAFEVTEASAAEQPAALRLVDQLEQRHGTLLERCGHLNADKGYDDGKLITRLWDEHQIKPVIDIRNCWRDGEASKVVKGQRNVIYTFDGEVSCVCPKTMAEHRMSYGGFERDRNTLEVPLSGARGGDRVQGDGAVSDARGSAHPSQRGSARVHPGGALQLRLEGPLRPAQRRGAGQQPLGRRVRVRRPVHPRAGQDAAALHPGAVDHAGDGARPHRSRSTRHLRSLTKSA